MIGLSKFVISLIFIFTCSQSYADESNLSLHVPIKVKFPHKIVYTKNASFDTSALMNDCLKRGGKFNECGSMCDERMSIGCVSVCALTCEFAETLKSFPDSVLIEFPILNKQTAIDYAKIKMPYDEALSTFKTLEKEHKIRGWQTTAKLRNPEGKIKNYKIQLKNGIISNEVFEEAVKNAKSRGEYWFVSMKSEGVIPSYSWNIEFALDGEIISNSHGWDK